MKTVTRVVTAAMLLVLVAGCAASRDATIQRIAFGSCNQHDKPQPIWDAVVATKPEIWIWTGDIVYADADVESLIPAAYHAQKARPEYRALLDAVPVIGTWDDHDYGLNNGGSEFPARAASQQALLDFLDEPADSPRREREGVYGSYVYGPPGRQVKVILLDTRYHRDQPGPDGDVLGEAQWKWLERELVSSARVTVLVSSIQFVAEEQRWEKWANFPRARERMLSIIGQSGASGLVVISGDRHIAEIARLEYPALAYPLYDVTSSGLTHSWDSFPGEPNRHRVGEVYPGLNFGTITIHWDADPVMLVLEIRGVDGTVRIRREVELTELGASR